MLSCDIGLPVVARTLAAVAIMSCTACLPQRLLILYSSTRAFLRLRSVARSITSVMDPSFLFDGSNFAAMAREAGGTKLPDESRCK